MLLPDGTGTARSALALAPSVSLIGAAFFHHSIPCEFSTAGALVAVRGSNALALTIGSL